MQEDAEMLSLLRHVAIADAFMTWLRDQIDELCDAAELLGGAGWRSRAAAVIEQARRGVDPVSNLGQMRVLRRLLHLGYVDVPGSDEAWRFAAIHPDDPRADNARLCAEALDRGIGAIEALHRAGVRLAREAA